MAFVVAVLLCGLINSAAAQAACHADATCMLQLAKGSETTNIAKVWEGTGADDPTQLLNFKTRDSNGEVTPLWKEMIAGDMSWEATVKVNVPPSQWTYGGIINGYSYSGASNTYYTSTSDRRRFAAIYIRPDGQTALSGNPDAGQALAWKGPSLTDSKWHHFVLVFSRSTGMTEYYLDGNLQASVLGDVGSPNPAMDGDLTFCAHLQKTFGCEVSRVALWSRALNSSEIERLQNCNNCPEPDLKALYTLDNTFDDSLGVSLPLEHPVSEFIECSDCTHCNYDPKTSSCDAEAGATGDPHIKTLDGQRYLLLSQGTFLLWQLSVVKDLQWELMVHYSGRNSFIKGLLLVERESPDRSPTGFLEISSNDCKWRARTPGSEWWVMDNHATLGTALVSVKPGEDGHNLVHLQTSGHTENGKVQVATISLSCRPHHYINVFLKMKRPEDVALVRGEMKVGRSGGKISALQMTDEEFGINQTWEEIGGSSTVDAYLRSMDEEVQVQMVNVNSYDQVEAKKVCSKHLGELDTQEAKDLFDDCIFDLCHGAGEVAAQLAAELLVSNRAIDK